MDIEKLIQSRQYSSPIKSKPRLTEKQWKAIETERLKRGKECLEHHIDCHNSDSLQEGARLHRKFKEAARALDLH